MFITKQAWRDSVLLGHIKKVWNEPDALYSTIVQSLQDGFGSDMIEPAERLAEIDPSAERGAVVLAIVYREQKRLADSEKVLRKYIEQHGEPPRRKRTPADELDCIPEGFYGPSIIDILNGPFSGRCIPVLNSRSFLPVSLRPGACVTLTGNTPCRFRTGVTTAEWAHRSLAWAASKAAGQAHTTDRVTRPIPA